MNKSRGLRWAGHVTRMAKVGVLSKFYHVNLQESDFWAHRCQWEDNIRMGLEERGINAGNWVDSTQDRDYWRALVNAALNLRRLK